MPDNQENSDEFLEGYFIFSGLSVAEWGLLREFTHSRVKLTHQFTQKHVMESVKKAKEKGPW